MLFTFPVADDQSSLCIFLADATGLSSFEESRLEATVDEPHMLEVKQFDNLRKVIPRSLNTESPATVRIHASPVQANGEIKPRSPKG